MVRAWYMSPIGDGDPRQPHMMEPPQFVTLDELRKTTGVEYFTFDADSVENDEKYAAIKKQRGYTYEDTCEISRETLPNYEEKLKSFFTEHLHADEEIRFILEGGGYFDIRDTADKWIRVELVKNDMIVLPAGIYHRFILNSNNYVKCKRLFIGEPVWTPINRPAEEHPKRLEYVKTMMSVA